MFDKTQQYGDWIVVTADGPDDVMAPKVKQEAEKELLKQAHSFIHEPFRSRIVIIHHGPDWVENPEYGLDGDDFEGAWVFTVAWKYKPLKEAAVG